MNIDESFNVSIHTENKTHLLIERIVGIKHGLIYGSI